MKMNWIFEAYSNVYTTATMQTKHDTSNLAVANAKPAGRFAKLFGRM
jgi:hypothetical protein